MQDPSLDTRALQVLDVAIDLLGPTERNLIIRGPEEQHEESVTEARTPG